MGKDKLTEDGRKAVASAMKVLDPAKTHSATAQIPDAQLVQDAPLTYTTRATCELDMPGPIKKKLADVIKSIDLTPNVTCTVTEEARPEYMQPDKMGPKPAPIVFTEKFVKPAPKGNGR